MTEPDYLATNRVAWDAQAPRYAIAGRRHWGQPEPTWGLFGVRESEVHRPRRRERAGD